VNTAPWQVLAALPLVVNSGGAVQTGAATLADQATAGSANVDLAKAIVLYRMQNGPFKTLFDLNRVLDTVGTGGFETAEGDIKIDAIGADAVTLPQGNLSAGDGVRDDFVDRYAQIARLSNILTTRSDVFTVYGVVEGWANAGTNSATRVVQRRFSFIIDRNSVNPADRTVKITNVPVN